MIVIPDARARIWFDVGVGVAGCDGITNAEQDKNNNQHKHHRVGECKDSRHPLPFDTSVILSLPRLINNVG